MASRSVRFATVAVASPVDWERIGRAMAFYSARGYVAVDVPWWVSPAITEITCPDAARVMSTSGCGDLVGSAEQSFLAMEVDGTLGRGRFVACTPCFRREPVVDHLHRLSFMKVELYRNDASDDRALEQVVADAEAFMNLERGVTERLRRVATGDGLDLEIDGVEVGSYGVRSHGSLSWTYGTGLAEPRFSTAVGIPHRQDR